jgi:hypothetical protein
MALVRHANSAGGAALLQALVGLLLLFGGNQGLARVATLSNARLCDELGAASAALLRHRLLEWKNPRFLGQQMAIVKIAMIHFLHLGFIPTQSCEPVEVLRIFWVAAREPKWTVLDVTLYPKTSGCCWGRRGENTLDGQCLPP